MPETLARADLWVIAIYMVAMLVIGWWVSDGNDDVEGYSVGNRRIAGWALGLSVLGTFLSSITFLALPATTYKENWNSYCFTMALPVAGYIACRWFIPLYRRQVRLSAYELLEQRFGVWARLYANLSYCVLQLIRVAMVTLLVALAVQPLLDWDGWTIYHTLITLGAVVIVYDVMGGFQAVVWTDVVQVFVLLFGALWCVWDLVMLWPGGAGAFFADLPSDKISLGDWNPWDVSTATVWVVFIYGLTENLRNYGADQNYVQRMIAAPSDREARKAIWMGALGYVPIGALFCLIGTGLAMHYGLAARSADGATPLISTPLPAGLGADEVFPHFIRHELTPAIAGLVIASILAAAMSTVDSCLNSTSTVIFADLIQRFRRGPWIVSDIILVRAITVLLGVAGTAIAVILYDIYREESRQLMTMWWKYAGLAGGGMFGLFLLAWLVPRTPRWGAAAGVLSSFVVLLWGTLARNLEEASAWKSWECPLHEYLIGVAATLVVFGVGVLAWLARRATRR